MGTVIQNRRAGGFSLRYAHIPSTVEGLTRPLSGEAAHHSHAAYPSPLLPQHRGYISRGPFSRYQLVAVQLCDPCDPGPSGPQKQERATQKILTRIREKKI